MGSADLSRRLRLHQCEPILLEAWIEVGMLNEQPCHLLRCSPTFERVGHPIEADDFLHPECVASIDRRVLTVLSHALIVRGHPEDFGGDVRETHIISAARAPMS